MGKEIKIKLVLTDGYRERFTEAVLQKALRRKENNDAVFLHNSDFSGSTDPGTAAYHAAE